MKRLLLAFLFPTFAFAAADLSLLKDIMGEHFVLAWQLEHGTPGKLIIHADEKGVGFSTKKLAMSSGGVEEITVVTPTADTELIQNGNKVIQHANGLARRISVTYEKMDGFFNIDATVCDESTCYSYQVTATQGSSPGEVVGVKTFMAAHAGLHPITKIGGVVPADAKTLDVDDSSDPAEAAIMAPFCEPDTNICDLGYNAFPYDSARIYQTPLSRGSVVYDLIVGKGADTKLFTWEDKDGVFVFRNYQYRMPSSKKIVFLEHEAKRAP